MNIRNLKTGDVFISLREFILLSDSSLFCADRIWGVNINGEEWVKRYDLAKESWDKYGTNPPMNVMVAVLVNGHGTRFPSLTDDSRFKMSWLPKQKLIQYKNGYEPYFGLEREEKGYPNNKAISLIEKPLWWRSVYILES